MSVYIDKLRNYSGKGQWCHMIADTPDELHLMADRIGMKRQWFQNHPKHPHYDLRPSMRKKAIANGAVELSDREFVNIFRLSN